MYTYRHTLSALALLLSTTAHAQNISVSLQPEFGGEQLTDGAWFVTRSGDSVQITAFRCYLSGFSVEYANGSSIAETDSYHLADAFDPATLQFELSGVPAGAVSGIRFSIGVDSAKSVSGAFGDDLDPARGMYWAWNSGYINAKLEGTSPVCAALHHAFEFHIGGYLPHQRTLREVYLPVTTSDTVSGITLIADVSSWLNGVELATTNRIVVPGTEAVVMADALPKLFKLRTP
jgi:hypothetical protein